MTHELPALYRYPSKRFGGVGCPLLGKRTRRIQAIGLHATAGSEGLGVANNVCHYFDQSKTPGNAHTIFDAKRPVQYAADDRAAWHASQGNQWSKGYEFCGQAGQTLQQWLDDLSLGGLRWGAMVGALDCMRYGIEPRLLTDDEVRAIHAGDTTITGFYPHSQIDRIWPKKNPHWDPGPHFPMLDYLLGVRGYIEVFTAQGIPPGWEWA